MAYMFQNCTNLTEIDFTNANTANVWTFRSLFDGCSSLNNIVGLDGLNTTKLQQTAMMFKGCSSLTSVSLFDWNTSALSEVSFEDYCQMDLIQNMRSILDRCFMGVPTWNL